MQYETLSFSDLVRNYEIAIPIIQRDYAQGRIDEKTKNIREILLNDINNKTEIKLDFVYGYIEQRDKREVFIPLDGQQRLTTLFLLHWYVAATNNVKNEDLKNFRYETRTSSTDFTQALVDNIDNLKIPLADEDSKSKKNANALSKTIKNSKWFFTSWKNDPTIAAMLVMLDAIHQRSIKEDKLEKIKFDFINMGNFKLSDDLYLKMNARGVQLTLFENFKSFFEEHLEKIDESLKNNTEETSLKKRFSDSIDNTWLDIFWKLDDGRNKDEMIFRKTQKVNDIEYQTIDEPFMHFFWYMTEMLYFKKNDYSDKIIAKKMESFKYDYTLIDRTLEEIIEKVYSRENKIAIEYLFDVLDNFEIINESCNDVLSSSYEEGKVALFPKGNPNLLQELIKEGSLINAERVILFTIINYVHENPNKNYSKSHLHDLVRVVRNLLKQGVFFNHSISKERFHKSITTITYLTEKLKTTGTDSVYHILHAINNDENLSTHTTLRDIEKIFIKDEKKKSLLISNNQKLREIIFELEDDSRIKGAIHNFMPANEISEQLLKSRKTAFQEIWKKDCSDITRGLLAISDYSIHDGYSSLGRKWLFGNKDSWIRILTQYNSNNNYLIDFLDKYNCSSGLESLQADYSQNTKEKDWRYYFVKYKNMTCANGYHNLFVFETHNKQSGFKIQNFSGEDYRKPHINPYIRTVIAKLKEKHGDGFIKNNIDKNKTEKGGDRANPLCLKSKMKLHCNREFKKEITLHCEEKGWKIEPALQPIKQEEKFNLIQDDGHFYLKPTEDKDMIEIAVEFISGLYPYVSGVPYDPSGLPIFPANPTV